MSWVRTLARLFSPPLPLLLLLPRPRARPNLLTPSLSSSRGSIGWFFCMRLVGSRVRRRWGSSCAGTDSPLLWRMRFHHLSSLEIHPG